jgi:hypothetical protein
MLLESLLKSQNDLSKQFTIVINDYLVSPKTNALLEMKISFQLIYDSGKKNDKSNSDDLGLKPASNLNYQSTASDFISTIKKTAQFALKNFSLHELKSR